MNTLEIIEQFGFKGKLVNVTENSQGNINKTYILTFDDNGTYKKYLLQKINSNVLKSLI